MQVIFFVFLFWFAAGSNNPFFPKFLEEKLLEMSLFGKIKSAVMGNPVTREYEVGKHIASAGPGLLWKVYAGVKRTTRQVCAWGRGGLRWTRTESHFSVEVGVTV